MIEFDLKGNDKSTSNQLLSLWLVGTNGFLENNEHESADPGLYPKPRRRGAWDTAG